MIQHELPLVVSGKRLCCTSPPSAEHDLKIAELLSNEQAMLHLRAMSKQDVGGWKVEDAAKRREFTTSEQLNKKGWFCNMTLKDSNEFIGIVGLRDIDWYNRSGEMGIIIHPEYWGKGYSGEAHYLIFTHAFEVLKLERIIFVTASSNTGMIAFCSMVLGAYHEGTGRNRFARSWTDPSQGYDNTEHYSVLSEEWHALKAKLETKYDLL